MTEALFTSPVKDGKVTGDIALRIRQMLALYEGKEVEITIRERKKRISQSQRGYFYAAIVPAFRLFYYENGTLYDDPDMKHYLKKEVGKLTRTYLGPDGKQETRVRSLESLSKEEMSVFIEVCLQHAAEIGLMIPPSERKS